MKVDLVTRRWCDALYGLAKRRGELDAVKADVGRIHTEVSTPNVQQFLFDARIPQAERRARIQPLLSSLTPVVANFVNLLFDKRREEVLRELGPAFHLKSLSDEGAVEGLVESPVALEPKVLEELERALGARLQKRVVLQNTVLPELLAGVRVVVDNRLLDFSASGRLEGLRRKMLEAPLPAATG